MSLLTEDRKVSGNLTASWNGVGTAPAGSVVQISAPAGSTLGLQVSGTFSETLQFEGLIDEVNGSWFSVNATPYPSGTAVTSTTTTGQWVIPSAGLRLIRVRCSAFTSGTANVALLATAGDSPQLGNASVSGGGGAVSTVRLEDGVGTNLATVAAFHNQDNTATGTGFGLLTGGVAQLLNQAGNLDRQREAGIDSVPALGISSGAASFAMMFQTTDSTDNFAAGTRTFTPVAMSGTIMGVSWSIQAGSVLTLDTGGNAENVVVTATTGTTFTCVTSKAHNGTVTAFSITGFVYNQERDVSGELDTKGAGAAVAVEYEYNSGAPGNINYDRGRNLNAKGLTTGTISSGGGIGSTSITFNSAPTGLQPGSPLLLTGGTAEVVYTTASYSPGTNPVAIQSAIANASHTGGSWESYAAQGPGLNGFLPFGVAIEEEALYDPVSGNFFLERSATQDAVSGQNVVMENAALWNGATMDREIEAPSASSAITRTGIGLDAIALWNASNSYVPWQGGTKGAFVQTPGTVSTVNSSTATLGANAVFTGTSEDVSGFASVVVSVFADQASAAGGLSLQFSSNGTNWDLTTTYTIAASVPLSVPAPPAAQFFRVVYTNGGTIQGAFRLQTVYHQVPVTNMAVGPFLNGISPSAGAGPLLAAASVVYDGTSDNLAIQRSLHSFGDGIAGGTTVGVGPLIYNGSTWDRSRSVGGATGTPGTGVPAAGSVLWDGVGAVNFVKQMGDGSGRAMVVGPAANQAASAGNPLLIAGSTAASAGNAQQLVVESAAQPNLRTSLWNAGNEANVGVAPDGNSAAGNALLVASYMSAYNGATMDRVRLNIDTVMQASTATSVGTVNYDFTNYSGRFILVHANVTSYGAAGTLQLSVQMKDANGLFVTLKSTTAVTTGADILLFVGPNSWPADAAPTFYGNFALPRTLRIVQTVGGNTITFSAAYSIGMA